MAATLTKAMLDDLHKGCASLSILGWTAPVALNGLDFKGADQLFSLKDSLVLSPDDPSGEGIYVDQKHMLIDYSVEPGDWTLTLNVPTSNEALYDYFFEKLEETVSITGQNGETFAGTGYGSPKEVELTFGITSESGKTSIALGHVKCLASYPNIENRSTPLYAKITGHILENGTYAKFAILPNYTAPAGA